jgi:hypothetical protein
VRQEKKMMPPSACAQAFRSRAIAWTGEGSAPPPCSFCHEQLRLPRRKFLHLAAGAAALPEKGPRRQEAGMALGLSFTRVIAHQMGAISSLGVGMPNAARRGTGRRSRP